MTFQPKVYTYTEFEAFIRQPGSKDRSFELIHGEIVEKMPTQEHAYIAVILAAFLHYYLTTNPIGWALVEARYKLPEDDTNAHIPDLSFVRAVEGRDLITDGPAPYMPEFAIEIKSPDDTYLQMREKAIYYLKHGTQMVWLVFPPRKQVEVHTADHIETFGIEDILDGGDVLPQFKVAVKDIFKTRPGVTD